MVDFLCAFFVLCVENLKNMLSRSFCFALRQLSNFNYL